jgi:hypothetical protein
MHNKGKWWEGTFAAMKKGKFWFKSFKKVLLMGPLGGTLSFETSLA